MIAFFFAITIFINEVMPAPSNAPEWVELYNPGTEAIDLSGWYLDDDTLGGTQILIPHGTLIPAGGLHVVIFGSAILNNTGDSITLYDTTGQLVDRIDFGSMKSTESISRVPDGSNIIIKALPSLGLFNAPTPTPTPTQPTTTPTTDSSNEITSTPTITPTQSTASTPTITPTQPTASTPTITPTQSTASTPTITPTQPTASTPIITPTQSTASTLSPSRTSSPSRTESSTRTPSLSRTPSPTRTPSMSKTPSLTRTPSLSKTPSDTPLLRPTRTASITRTPSPTKTPSLTRTPKPSKTSSPTKTMRQTRTASAVTGNHETPVNHMRTTIPILTLALRTRIPHVVVCPPAPTNLHNWALTATHHQIFLPDSTTCVHITLPENAPAHWQLVNPHGLVIAEIDVHTQHCALDISACRPSPTLVQQVFHVDYQLPSPTGTAHTATPVATAPLNTPTAHVLPTPPRTNPAASTIPIGMLLMLGGWIALKMLARPAPDVLYSESGEDAASSADSLSSESRKV